MIKWEVRRLFNEMAGVSISCYEITISRRNRKHSELKILTKRNNMERYKMENRQAIKLSFEFRFSGLTTTPGLMRMPEHSECKYTSARWSMSASIRSLFRFGKQTRSYTTIKSSRQMLKRCPRYVSTSRWVALHEPSSIDLSISSLSNRYDALQRRDSERNVAFRCTLPRLWTILCFSWMAIALERKAVRTRATIQIIRRQFYGRVIALSRLFVYSKNERFSNDDRDTNERTNTTRCTISRECIKRAKKNIFNDTKRMKWYEECKGADIQDLSENRNKLFIVLFERGDYNFIVVVLIFTAFI